MIRIGIIGVLGVFINILIWPATSALWRDSVHKAVLEQKVDAGWAADIPWTLIDGGFAVLAMGGIGIGLAAAIVASVSTRLARR